MDLIRKNLGLIAYTIACFVLAGFIVVGIKRAAATASDLEDKVTRQKQFYKKIKSNSYGLTKSNLLIARQNAGLVRGKFRDLRNLLTKQYSIPRERPPTSLECVRILDNDIRSMTRDLMDKDIVPGSGCTHFSFDALAQDNSLPPARHVPGILRQLTIVKEVVRLVGMAEIKELSEIRRPMRLGAREEGLYIVIPIEVVVIGKLAEITKLVDLFHRDSRYLFFLRYMTLEADDQAPDGLVASYKGRVGADGGGDRGMGMGMGGGMGMEEGGMDEMAGMDGMGMGPDMGRGRMGAGRGTRGAEPDQGDGSSEEIALTRKDLTAFDMPRLLRAKLRFELVEFMPPDSDDEEEN